MKDVAMLSVRIPEELKQQLDMDERSNQDVVTTLLQREYSGGGINPLEQRMEEKRRRLEMVEDERERREKEIEQLRGDLERLESDYKRYSTKTETQVEERVEKLSDIPVDMLDVSNPAIVQAAKELPIAEWELIDRVKRYKEENDVGR